MSSNRYSELKACEEARKELKEALGEALENQAKLRALNAELVVMLRRASVRIAPDLGIGPDRLLDGIREVLAKAEKLQ